MTKTFFLKIEMGNAAMQTPSDIVHALRETARRIRDSHAPQAELINEGLRIRDINGNTVGTARIVEGDDE